MQAKILLNLILLLIILALVWFILFIYQPQNTQTNMPNFTNLDKNQVQNIHIIREDEIKLEKIDAIWHITKPLQLEANQFRIDSLLHLLHTKHYQTLSEPADLAVLGLQPPQMQLIIDKLHLDLGFKSPFNDNRRYVRQEGQVSLVIDTFSPFLSGDATLFASLSPLGQNSIITNLKLPELELNLHGIDWIITPEQTNISADSIQNLLKNWQNLQALSVRPYQLPDTAQIIEIKLQNAHHLKFELINNGFEFILAAPDKQVQYHIAAEQMGALLNLISTPAISM